MALALNVFPRGKGWSSSVLSKGTFNKAPLHPENFPGNPLIPPVQEKNVQRTFKKKHDPPCVSASSIVAQQLPVTWSNPRGEILSEIVVGRVWTADRPFVWNEIDVGGRMAVVRMSSGERDGGDNDGRSPLWVHSPVALDEGLKQEIDSLGKVAHIVSPNFEHCKYAQDWIEAYPNATSYACPGLKEIRPDISYTSSIGLDDVAPPDWSDEFEIALFDCEHNPFNRKPFFNEVVFLHKPSKALFVTDIFWNYPHDVPFGTRLWKFGMDVVYHPFYKNFMICNRDKFEAQAKRVLSWDWDILVPCHGTVSLVGGKDLLRRHLQ